MRPGLIQMVRTLTEADRKTLSQKSLKLGEEYGELASTILPYEGGDTTQHKYASAAHVLEEVADVMLVAMSIAFDLGYSEEDIFSEMTRKAGKWAEKQSRHGDGRYPFEIHITVRDVPNLDHFRETCAMLGVKPIILALQAQTGEMTDMMTSSVIMGDNASARKEVDRISGGLKERGYEVVREKVETAPWHPAAPTTPLEAANAPADTYFEAHLAVRLGGREECPGRDVLAAIAKQMRVHLSKNIFKVNSDGTHTIMLTARANGTFRAEFESHASDLRVVLLTAGFVVDKLIIEYAVYDSNNGHDSGWMAGTKRTDSAH
jgi:NTP pyrophosphatase (non-canonical NTP hydrolase)